MRISVSEAKARLTDLVRMAEQGEEVILTRHGQEVVRLAAIAKKKLIDRDARRKFLEEISKAGAARATPGPSAARSQDFLYDEFGLPK
jgi:prevent-host-death family protein